MYAMSSNVLPPVRVALSCETCIHYDRSNNRNAIGICKLRQGVIEKKLQKDDIEFVDLITMYTARWQTCDSHEMTLTMRQRIILFEHNVKSVAARDYLC